MPGLYDQVESQLDGDDSSAPKQPFFDRLSKKLDEQTEGVTTTDLIHMKGVQKKVMLFLLRDTEAATQGITLANLKAKLPDVADEMPKALTELTNQGWLFISGEPPHVRYRVHMRRKRSGDLGIWSNLATKFSASDHHGGHEEET